MASPNDDAGHSDARFNRTVERIGAEAFWLHTYQNAIDGMKGVDAVGLDFFRVALNSLKDARLIRLIRALEDDSQTASFWYLLKSNASKVRKAAEGAALDLSELRRVADALRLVRDKTFVHIDKDGVFNPQIYYEEANLNNEDVGRMIRSFWATMRALHFDVFGTEIQADEYDGADIGFLANLRDAASV